MILDLLLFLLAAICVGLHAFGVTSSRIHLAWLGMFFFLVDFALHAAGVA